jgi:tetratricopeptide (TPR) repeat protein/predicted Ser/Thr protein kinase
VRARRAPESLLTPELLDDASLEAAAMHHAVRQRLFGGPPGVFQIDRFVVLERIGHGGMGVVFEAYDPKLERKIALKVLRPTTGEDGPIARQRMLREARALAKLSHPNVVPVFDVGEHDEHVFIAMELVRGPTLHEHARAPGRTVRQIVDVYVQAARGLAAAHELGLVHRDFKPTNALVGEEGRVRVLDFGLVQLEAATTSAGDDPAPRSPPAATTSAGDDPAPRSPPASLTQTGMRVGTPAYMAPEQRHGTPSTPASDQYSWCVSLLEALTGSPPPGPARARGTLEALAACPRSLRPLLERGLAEDPAQRWPSMQVLVDRLEATGRRGRRGLLALGSLGTGMLVVAAVLAPRGSPCEAPEDAWAPAGREAAEHALLAVSPELARSTTAALDRYAQEESAARAEVCVAHHERHTSSAPLFDRAMLCLERRRSALESLVDHVPDLETRALPRVLEAVESLPPIEPCRDHERLLSERPPPEDPEAAARVAAIQRDLDQALTLDRLGDIDGSLQLARDADQRAVEVGYRPIQARTALFIGVSRRTRGALDEASTRVQDALWLAEAGADDELVALASAELVSTFALLGLADDVRTQARRTQAAIERVGRRTRADLVLSDGQGILAQLEGRLQDAREHYAQALAHAEQLPGLPPSTVGTELDKLASIHVALGERERADALLERAMALKEASLGRLHPSVLATRFHIASAAVEHGRLDEAVRDLEAVLEDAERSMGEGSTLVGVIHGNLAVAHTKAGREAEAIEHGERCVTVLRGSLGDDSPQLLAPMMNLAETHALHGRPDRARALLEQALTLGRATIGEGADLGGVLLSLAELQLETGDPATALALAREAVGMLERAIEQPGNEEVARGHRVIAKARRALGENEAPAAAPGPDP